MKNIKKITIGVASIRGAKVEKMSFCPVDANGRRAIADYVGQAVIEESYANEINIGVKDIYITARVCIKVAKALECKVSAFVREVLSQGQIRDAFEKLMDANSELSKAAKAEKRAKENLFLLCDVDSLTETAGTESESESEDDPELIAARKRYCEAIDDFRDAKERATSARAAYKAAVESYTATTKIFQANA